MPVFSSNVRIILFYFLLITFCCFPIWSVGYFVNQDGSPHLYNAYLMNELIKGNPVFTEIYALNQIPVPNQSGHWVLAFLLLFFSPAVCTKIIVTLIFAGFVAAAGWLRLTTVGRDGIKTSLLLGAALAFNWMWFLGFYNFAVGAAGFAFTIGLYQLWKNNLNIWRCAALSALILLIYFSHLIAFAMLAGSMLIIGVFHTSNRRGLIWTIISFVPVVPFIVAYKLLSEAGGSLFPVWLNLANPLSVTSWLTRIFISDPFQLLSRRAFPFITSESLFFAVFAPSIWLFIAIFCLLLSTYLIWRKTRLSFRHSFIWLFLFFSSFIFWLIGFDDFGKSHGGILRERVLLLGVLCVIPFFQLENILLKRIAQVCLIFVLVFQTAAILEYSIHSDKTAREFLAAQPQVGENDSIASILLIKNDCRFKSMPLTSLTNLIGIEKNTRIWDNYELGFYLFPVIAKNPSARQFVSEFRELNTFELCNSQSDFAGKIAELDSFLSENHNKINILLVWEKNEKIDEMLKKWFENTPFFENGRVRLFRHR